MTIRYFIATPDMLRFNKYHLTCTQDGKAKVLRLRLFYVALHCFGIFLGYLLNVTWIVPVLICMGIAAVIFAPRIMFAHIERKIRKSAEKGEPLGIYGDIDLRIEPEGFHVTYDKGSAFLKWSGVKKITESETDTFFYLRERDALFVPHTAFASDAEREQFVETARRYRENAVGLVI